MTFLNPAALWGLLALSVPIIVHFFNLQRPKQILFSNVAFVKEVKRTVVRRVRFQRWLLLLLRLLGLAALVLMFANPVRLESGQRLVQGARSVVIVIDNSESMKASNERGEYLRQAISLARNLIKAYGPEDEFVLSGTGNLALQAGFSGKEEILDQLEQLSYEQNTRSLAEILSLSDGLFERSTGALRELYLISDFQASTVLTDSTSANVSDSSLLISLVPVASRQPANVYISDHEVITRILEADKPMTMRLTLVNDGPTAVQDLSVRVLLQGKAVAISTQSLEANERKPIEITFTPGASGWLSGYIELDDRPIDFDNQRYFSCYVPDKEPILLVESVSSPNLRILYQDVFDQFETTVVSDRSLANVNFANYRSVVWTGLERISSGLADQLTRFIEGGGSVLIFPGENANIEEWNRWLGQISFGSLSPLVRVEEGISAQNYDLDHPIFEGIFSQTAQRAKPDPTRVFRYFPVNLSGALPQSKIIQMENQQPLLIESEFGTGSIFLFSLFPGGSWTDFQVKTLFPPLIYRITQLMNQTGELSFDQVIGAHSPLLLRTLTSDRIDLRDVNGVLATPERSDLGGETRIIFDQMSLKAGNYEVVQEGQLLLAISFNVADAESRLAFADESGLQEKLREYGIADQTNILEPNVDTLVDQVQFNKEGWPLWRWFLTVALICLLVEAFVLGGKVTWKGKTS